MFWLAALFVTKLFAHTSQVNSLARLDSEKHYAGDRYIWTDAGSHCQGSTSTTSQDRPSVLSLLR